jgi:site-specific recombinase XerD
MTGTRREKRHDSPARIYLESLSPGSHWGMSHALETIAEYLSDGEHTADTFPWSEVRFRDAAAVRSFLADRYKPSTVNKMLAAFRGVMKQTWRLGLIDAETYRRTIDIDNMKGSTLLRGRALEGEELSALFRVCAEDPSPAGRRDAAMLAVLYGAGIRRAELAGLDLDDFTNDACSLRVRNGKRQKQRTVYLAKQGCLLVREWVRERGDEPGPLFCPVRQTGEVRATRMRGESITYILQRRQRAAGVEGFSPHDLRRSCLTSMLENGVDVFTVQKLAGHADPSTTARYDRRGEAAKLEAAQGLRFG